MCKATSQAINFMAQYARGLICLALTPQRVEELHLIVGIEGYGLQVVEGVPIEISPRAANWRYLRTKKEKMGICCRQGESRQAKKSEACADLLDWSEKVTADRWRWLRA